MEFFTKRRLITLGTGFAIGSYTGSMLLLIDHDVPGTWMNKHTFSCREGLGWLIYIWKGDVQQRYFKYLGRPRADYEAVKRAREAW
jgi:hypothetical protein